MSTDPLSRLRQGLHKHFGPGAAVFVDTLLWLTGHVCVDIVRLDYWLQQRNPDYLDECMRGFIRRQYGEKAERFVAYWLKGEPREAVTACRSNLHRPGGTCGSHDEGPASLTNKKEKHVTFRNDCDPD